jgi:hypothetical protein
MRDVVLQQVVGELGGLPRALTLLRCRKHVYTSSYCRGPPHPVRKPLLDGACGRQRGRHVSRDRGDDGVSLVAARAVVDQSCISRSESSVADAFRSRGSHPSPQRQYDTLSISFRFLP